MSLVSLRNGDLGMLYGELLQFSNSETLVLSLIGTDCPATEIINSST